MTAEVPEDKVRRTVAAIEKAMNEQWVSASDLQSLLGLIGFVGQVLVSGRWRVPWTITAMRVAVKAGFSPMSGYWLEELQWWHTLLTKWNRVSMILKPELLIPMHSADMAPFTDASGGEANGGAGAVFGKYWMAFLFTKEEVQQLPICDLEGVVSVLWLIEVCLHRGPPIDTLWGHFMGSEIALYRAWDSTIQAPMIRLKIIDLMLISLIISSG